MISPSFDDALVLSGNDRFEQWQRFVPVIQNTHRLGRLSSLLMLFEYRLKFRGLRIGYRFDFNQPGIDAARQFIVFIQHIGDSTGHACSEIISNRAKDHRPTAGHVFAAVIAHAFHNGGCTGIAHAEAFACQTSHICLAAGRAVQRDIADQDIVWIPCSGFRRTYRQYAAGQSLAEIIVGFAVQCNSLSMIQERAKCLTAEAIMVE